MLSPVAHFPVLKSLQLYLRNNALDECDRWTSPIWIWAFLYLALERLEAVSVVSKDYMIRDPAGIGEWGFLNEVEQKEYEGDGAGRHYERVDGTGSG
jgi:hypothetical protein